MAIIDVQAINCGLFLACRAIPTSQMDDTKSAGGLAILRLVFRMTWLCVRRYICCAQVLDTRNDVSIPCSLLLATGWSC